MGVLPMAVYGLEVPAGGVPIAAKTDIPASFRITMAAIDPSAEPEETEGNAPPRATLKILRAPLIDFEDSDDEDEFDPEEMEAMLASDSEEDEEANGGPSDPAKGKKARKAAAVKQLKKELAEDMDIDEAPKGKGKGKAKALQIQEEFDDDDDEDDEDDDSDDEDDFEPEEFVLCTLDPVKNYQQTLDITIGEDERVWFVVSGTHSVYLTGNYVEPDHTHGPEEYDSEDDEDEYDLSPDEDELDDDLSEDELDDIENPRITEVGTDDEEAPKLIKADKKGKNKRAADETDDASTLDDLISKSAAAEPKLSKKQAKKLKTNEGKAVAAEKVEEAPSSDKKKVQFAKNLEQGPTGSPAPAKAAAAAAAKPAEKPKTALGPKVVQGVTVDDKKLGSGPAAKRGDRVGMRYIGKLQKDGKVFDSNKKGKPFSFKLGTGEVIKGWDIGIAGMTVGGERRITVPAHLAYGSKSLPGIPGNSTLIFDVKCLEIK